MKSEFREITTQVGYPPTFPPSVSKTSLIPPLQAASPEETGAGPFSVVEWINKTDPRPPALLPRKSKGKKRSREKSCFDSRWQSLWTLPSTFYASHARLEKPGLLVLQATAAFRPRFYSISRKGCLRRGYNVYC